MVQKWWLDEGERIDLIHGIACISAKTALFLLIPSPNDSKERVDAFCTLKCKKKLLFIKLHKSEWQQGQDGEIWLFLYRKTIFHATIHLSGVADDG